MSTRAVNDRDTNGDEVPPAYPTTQRLVKALASDPISPLRLDNALLEHWAAEEEGSKGEDSSDVEDGDWVPTQQV